MQTFLPYADFFESVKVLDKKRCWKQVVEAKQIISCLCETQTRWINHPAVKMWVGYESLLKQYFNIFLKYCLEVHKINTKMQPYDIPLDDNQTIPFWLGNENFHRAMRSRLIAKDKNFYLPKFPKDENFNDSKYFWPVMETQSFRII